MTSGHLITNRNLSLLRNVDTYRLIYSRRQFITVLSCKYLRIYNNTIFSVWYFQGSVTYFTCLLTKDCTKQSLFCCKFCLSLRSNLTYQNISGAHFCTDTDNTTLIQILQRVITYTRDISCNFLRSKFGISRFCFIFLNMNRCIYIVLHQSLTKQNGILVVVTFPGHKSDQRVLTKGHLAL